MGCDGEVFAIAGSTKNHDDLAFNLRCLLVACVDEKGCEMTGSGVKVMTKKGRCYRYPDLAISCDERDKSNEIFHQFPKLIAKVLSGSTQAIDRGDKFQEYIQIPTLEEYVLVSTRRMQVECFRRGEGRMWLYFSYGEGDRIPISCLDTEFPIEQLYRNVQLAA